MLDFPNLDRPFLSYALHLRHFNRILFSKPHLPRCKLWLTDPKFTRQRRIILFYLHLHTHRPRSVLRVISLQRDLKYWCYPISARHNDRFRRLRSTLRSNIILGRHSNYQSTLSGPLYRRRPGSMNLRRVLSRQRNTDPIFRLSLPSSICYRSRNHPPSPLPPRDRVE